MQGKVFTVCELNWRRRSLQVMVYVEAGNPSGQSEVEARARQRKGSLAFLHFLALPDFAHSSPGVPRYD